MSKIDYSMNEFVDELCEEAMEEIQHQCRVLKENFLEDDNLNTDMNIISIAAMSIAMERALFKKILEDMGIDTDELIDKYIPDIDDENMEKIMRP